MSGPQTLPDKMGLLSIFHSCVIAVGASHATKVTLAKQLRYVSAAISLQGSSLLY